MRFLGFGGKMRFFVLTEKCGFPVLVEKCGFTGLAKKCVFMKMCVLCFFLLAVLGGKVCFQFLQENVFFGYSEKKYMQKNRIF